jgi:hypothetical protein
MALVEACSVRIALVIALVPLASCAPFWPTPYAISPQLRSAPSATSDYHLDRPTSIEEAKLNLDKYAVTYLDDGLRKRQYALLASDITAVSVVAAFLGLATDKARVVRVAGVSGGTAMLINTRYSFEQQELIYRKAAAAMRCISDSVNDINDGLIASVQLNSPYGETAARALTTIHKATNRVVEILLASILDMKPGAIDKDALQQAYGQYFGPKPAVAASGLKDASGQSVASTTLAGKTLTVSSVEVLRYSQAIKDLDSALAVCVAQAK